VSRNYRTSGDSTQCSPIGWKQGTHRCQTPIEEATEQIDTMTTTTILNGLVGGVLATVVMTMFMMALGDDSPPPTALFWSKYVEDGTPDEFMMQGMALHFVYGIGAGGLLAAVLVAASVDVADTALTVGAGLGYGFVLFVFAAMFWMNVMLDVDPEPADIGQFLLFHLIYGAVLGGVLGLGLV
jgi:hypothetical protein